MHMEEVAFGLLIYGIFLCLCSFRIYSIDRDIEKLQKDVEKLKENKMTDGKKAVTLYRVVVVYVCENGEHREHEYSVYDDEKKASDIVDKIKQYPCIRIQEYKGKWTYTIYRVYMEPMTPINEPFHAEQFAKQKSWAYE